jgi:hypothetical protein
MLPLPTQVGSPLDFLYLIREVGFGGMGENGEAS